MHKLCVHDVKKQASLPYYLLISPSLEKSYFVPFIVNTVEKPTIKYSSLDNSLIWE